MNNVELNSAASGVVNLLTVIGMVKVYKERKLNGLIHPVVDLLWRDAEQDLQKVRHPPSQHLQKEE